MNKRRVTKSQKIGNNGQLQVAEMFDSFGWEPRPLSPDLGEDLIVDVYDDGISAGLAFYVQTKSSMDISSFQIKKGSFSYLFEVKDLEHWEDYSPRVVLLLWDIQKKFGHWIWVDQAIKHLNSENPKWRSKNKIKVYFPQANTTQPEDLKRLRCELAKFLLPLFGSGKKLEIKLKLEFPNDFEGNLENDAMRYHMATGESITISGQHVSEIKFSDWYERKFGKSNISPEGKIVFGPRHSERVDKIRVIFLTHQGNINTPDKISL